MENFRGSNGKPSRLKSCELDCWHSFLIFTDDRVRGQVHETVRRDGTVDPAHLSGVIFSSTRRLLSFHFYPETGLLQFSKKLPPVYEDELDDQDNLSSSDQHNAQPEYGEWKWVEEEQSWGRFNYWTRKWEYRSN